MSLSAGGALDSGRIRELRGPRDGVDPLRPIGWEWEAERAVGGGTTDVLTVFLAGAECPFTCVFCDLWRYTTETATPMGAIPAQLQAALEAEQETISAADESRRGRGAAVKLYNASNFFDCRAVPPEDDSRVARLLAPFRRVTVECHARLVGPRCLEFADRIDGRLEVALGLETVHPEALPALNKGMTLDDFRQAAGALRGAGVGIRVFVLLGAPFVPFDQTVEWTVRSVEFAFEQGADRVSLIPVRGGNGAMEELREAGRFLPPTLHLLEEALERCLPFAGRAEAIVEADLWDAERFAGCADCAGARVERLRQMNLSGSGELALPCPSCNGS